jgi:hypothetical protein
MCLSPHEMSSARLEELIATSEELLADPDFTWDWLRQIHEGRIENMRKLLKERADNGTY